METPDGEVVFLLLITRGEGNRAIRESGIFPEVPMSSCR